MQHRPSSVTFAGHTRGGRHLATTAWEPACPHGHLSRAHPGPCPHPPCAAVYCSAFEGSTASGAKVHLSATLQEATASLARALPGPRGVVDGFSIGPHAPRRSANPPAPRKPSRAREGAWRSPFLGIKLAGKTRLPVLTYKIWDGGLLTLKLPDTLMGTNITGATATFSKAKKTVTLDLSKAKFGSVTVPLSIQGTTGAGQALSGLMTGSAKVSFSLPFKAVGSMADAFYGGQDC